MWNGRAQINWFSCDLWSPGKAGSVDSSGRGVQPADSVIGAELGASCVAQQQSQCLLPRARGGVCCCQSEDGPGKLA